MPFILPFRSAVQSGLRYCDFYLNQGLLQGAGPLRLTSDRARQHGRDHSRRRTAIATERSRQSSRAPLATRERPPHSSYTVPTRRELITAWDQRLTTRNQRYRPDRQIGMVSAFS
jgi:hypothetical protein